MPPIPFFCMHTIQGKGQSLYFNPISRAQIYGKIDYGWGLVSWLVCGHSFIRRGVAYWGYVFRTEFQYVGERLSDPISAKLDRIIILLEKDHKLVHDLSHFDSALAFSSLTCYPWKEEMVITYNLIFLLRYHPERWFVFILLFYFYFW